MGTTILKILKQHYRPAITPELERAFRKIMDCRTIELGGHICSCPDHHSYAVLYNSCRHRGCPQCNELWRLNKKAVADILLDSVKESYEQLYKTEGIRRGVINVFHSTGKNLAKHIRGIAVDEREIRSVSDEAIEIVHEYNGRQVASRIKEGYWVNFRCAGFASGYGISNYQLFAIG